MMPVIFIIGVLNLILGFALALLLERQIVVPFPQLRAEPAKPDVVMESPALDSAPLEDVRATLPSRWLGLVHQPITCLILERFY